MLCPIRKVPYWPQWLAGLTVNLAVLVTGLSNGWTSPYLARLTSPDAEGDFSLTAEEASWVASFLQLGRFTGAISAAILQGIIGRKKTLLLSSLPLTLGWICIMTASNVTYVYIARVLCGLASGMIWSALPLFMSEIADPKIRGSLIFLNLNFSTIGIFIGNTLGAYLSMQHFAFVSLAITVLFMVFFAFIPETPYHYVAMGNIEKAEESLKWYKQEDNVKQEILELQKYVGSTGSISFTKKCATLRNPVHRNNLATMIIINIFLHCAGNNTMNYYAEIILRKSAIAVTPSIVVMGLSFSTLVVGALATVLVDRFERRHLLVSTSILTAIALIALGCHFHMMSMGISMESFTWLPILSLILYNFSLACGLVPVPCALIGELFPPAIKTFAASNQNASSALLSFIVSRAFQPFLDLVGEKYVFWTFAASAMSLGVFACLFLPETKGKTLLEIQNSIEKCDGVVEKEKTVGIKEHINV